MSASNAMAINDVKEGEFIGKDEPISYGVLNPDPAIVKTMATFLATWKEQRENLQSVLIAAAIRVERTGETDDVEYIIRCLEKDDGKESAGINRGAVIKWINAHTRANVDYDSKEKKNIVRYAADKTTRLEEGKAKPWHTMGKQGVDFSGFSFDSVLESALNQNQKMSQKRVKLVAAGKLEEANEIVCNSHLVAAIRKIKANPALLEMVLKDGVIEH